MAKPKPRAPQQVQILSQEEPEMNEIQQAIEDTKADLEYAEDVLRQRANELEAARGKMEEARRNVDKLTRQYRNLLQSQVTGEPA